MFGIRPKIDIEMVLEMKNFSFPAFYGNTFSPVWKLLASFEVLWLTCSFLDYCVLCTILKTISTLFVLRLFFWHGAVNLVFTCIKFHNFALVSSKDFIRNKLPFCLLIYRQMFCYSLFYMKTATSGRGYINEFLIQLPYS